MKEYREGDTAFWNGKKITDNPYIGGSADSFRNWRMGYLYAKSVSMAREQEVEGD